MIGTRSFKQGTPYFLAPLERGMAKLRPDSNNDIRDKTGFNRGDSFGEGFPNFFLAVVNILTHLISISIRD